MSCSDPIADMLTRIRNASRAGLPSAEMGHSRMKAEIARILEREGFISGFAEIGEGAKKVLRITLKYDGFGRPVVRQLRRVSRPGLRRYVGVGDIPRVRGGIGTTVLSTSRGVMSDREARAARIGGEVLCQVW